MEEMWFKSLRWDMKKEKAGWSGGQVVKWWMVEGMGGGGGGDSNLSSPSLAVTEVSENNICKAPL